MSLKIAFSPCPNDTFIFCALVNGMIPHPFKNMEVLIADLPILNALALNGDVDIGKISFGAFPQFEDRYDYLKTGAALGFGNGPKLIARDKHFNLSDLSNTRLVHAGFETTAAKLFHFLFENTGAQMVAPYEQIEELVESNEADLGLLIHESRFTFHKRNLHEIADLGKLWEEKTGLPLPLGGLVAKKTLYADATESRAETSGLLRGPLSTAEQFRKALQESISFAWSNPDAVMPYVLKHSIEKNPDVVKAHIDLYVNHETYALSALGEKAIKKILSLFK